MPLRHPTTPLMRQQEHLKRLTAVLEKLCYSRNAYTAFRDFVAMAEATLRMMPVNLQSAMAGQGVATDPPDIQALWSDLRNRYELREWDYLAEAFNLLLECGYQHNEPTYEDLIGALYMTFAVSRNGVGQFFTPPHVGQMMGQMVLGDTTDTNALVIERVHCALAQAGGAVEATLRPLFDGWARHQAQSETPATWDVFAQMILPAIRPYYQPITVNDPACGSGGLLLGAARQFPRWANAFGLVVYYATDIDWLCVKMAQVNMYLYQLHCVIECRDALANPR